MKGKFTGKLSHYVVCAPLNFRAVANAPFIAEICTIVLLCFSVKKEKKLRPNVRQKTFTYCRIVRRRKGRRWRKR